MVEKMRKHTKSRNGCRKCRVRRIKCDEGTPNCVQCTKKGFQCPGYARPVKWSTKHEKLQHETHFDSTDWFAKEAASLAALISSKEPNSVELDNESELPTSSSTKTPEDTPEDTPHDPEESSLDSGIHDITTRIELPSEDPDILELLPLPSDGMPEQSGEAILEDDFAPDPGTTEYEEFDDSVWSSSSDRGLSDGSYFSSSPCSYSDDTIQDTEPYRHNRRLSDVSTQSLISLHIPDNLDMSLIGHYSSFLCQMNSCFDSTFNPFRKDVPRMLQSSPVIYFSILSMSAAHFFQHHKEKTSIALRYQTEAISSLTDEVAKLERTPTGVSNSGTIMRANKTVKDEVVLGVILLGITSAWHNPSSTGLAHLQGARSLFKAWAAANKLHNDGSTEGPIMLNQSQDFIVSSMVYWEAFTAFIMDQSLDDLAYLSPFCEPDKTVSHYVNPWTGVSTALFLYLAKVAIIMRHKRLVDKMHILPTGPSSGNILLNQIFAEARRVEQQILSFSLPSVATLQDPGDHRSPITHLVDLARCYRLAALLELYRTFPALLLDAADEQAETDMTPTSSNSATLEQKAADRVYQLACAILTILKSLPIDAGSRCTQPILFVIAGSALARPQTPGEEDAESSLAASGTATLQFESIEHELSDVSRRRPHLEYWRTFVRERFISLYRYIGLDYVRRMAIIVERAWTRMDIASAVPESPRAQRPDQIHWMDVMSEERLETIMG